MTIPEYAQSHGLDNDTALTHVLLFSAVEASAGDEQWRRRRFEALLRSVDAAKFAATVRELAREIIGLVEGSEPEGHEEAEVTS
jgi:hypothetical protein